MDDNSIITKFDRSEKENRLLAQFYNSKPQKLSTTTSIKSPPFEETKTNFPKQSNVLPFGLNICPSTNLAELSSFLS